MPAPERTTQRTTRSKTAAELLGVPEVAASGRERLVDIAIDLFYTHGFNAVGIDRVIETAGVTKTTFYKHFESKDDLMVAAVKKRDAWETRAWNAAIHKSAGDDPRAQFLALFDLFDQWFNAPDYKGCLFINTAIEFPNPSDPIHQAAAAHKRLTRDAWRDLAKKAGATDPDTFADLYATLVEGTLIMRQVHGRNDAARVSRQLAEALINQHLPA